MYYLYANWKSNKNIIQAADWVTTLQSSLSMESKKALEESKVEIGIFPSSPHLQKVSELIKGKKGFVVGTQDVSEYGDGKHTGLVSASAFAGIATHALVGHAEMRSYGDTQEKVASKFGQAIAHSISPVVCLRNDKEMIKGAKIVAYEPEFAIGTGVIASNEEIKAMRDKIKAITDCVFLYGGSVAEANIHTLLKESVCDGFLIGGASLDAKEFARIVHIVST